MPATARRRGSKATDPVRLAVCFQQSRATWLQERLTSFNLVATWRQVKLHAIPDAPAPAPDDEEAETETSLQIASSASSHQRMECTNRRAGQVIYWPFIDQDITNCAGACQTCQ